MISNSSLVGGLWTLDFGHWTHFNPRPARHTYPAVDPGKIATCFALRESCRGRDLQLPAHPDLGALRR